MGKPTKPRVKGNMKPASSSRAAELASSSRSLSFENLGGFAQFVSNSPLPTAIPSRPSTPSGEIYAVELDPELVVILKKISKRDVTTKLKALEELESYLKTNKSAIQLILNNWVTLYNKLVLEVDRRVRLIANQVHALITANAKKKFAPILKELIGPWLLSMYDSSKDIVKVSQSAFETVFAADKRLGVISFCQKEILDYITDMLLYKTPETLSDARYVTKEEMFSKYARVVSSSLQILSYLIQFLPLEERTKESYETIFDDTTMWKRLSTNESPLIRKAFYSFICTLLISWIEVVESRLDLICPCFYASVFTEKDTMTHSDMWDALLLMTKKLPQSWIVIGKKKPALPKLFHLLRSGLNGSPNITYPSLLALLAHLPKELKEMPNFYTDVFDNFWKGLNTEYIDRSNSYLFLNAYAECIIYFAISLSKTKQEDALQIATVLIEQTFFNMIQSYFLNIKNFDKLDLNGYAIIAKHTVILFSNEQLNLLTFRSQLDDLLIQTLIDCDTKLIKAQLDMNLFCQKVAHFMTALSYEIKQNNKDIMDLKNYANDLAQRLLLTSVESAMVHKQWAHGLLVLGQQLLHLDVEITKKLIIAVQQLLRLLEWSEGDEAMLTSFATFYVTCVTQTDEGSTLWTALMNILKDMLNDSELISRSVHIFILTIEQSQKVPYRCDALDTIVKQALSRLMDPQFITVPRSLLEKMVSFSLSIPILSDTTITEIMNLLTTTLVSFNRHYEEERSSFLLESVQSVLTILQNAHPGLMGRTIDWIGEVFDIMFIDSPVAPSASEVWDLYKHSADSSYLIERVKRSITDIHYAASPSDNAHRIKTLLTTYKELSVEMLLGTEQEWKTLSDHLLVSSHDLTLSFTDPFIALSLKDDLQKESETINYDLYGLSGFARLAFCWGEYLFSENKRVECGWLIRQLMMTVMCCEQGLMCPGYKCRIWQPKAVDGVRTFVQSMHSVFIDWLTHLVPIHHDVLSWNNELLASVMNGHVNDQQPLLLRFVAELIVVNQPIFGAHVLQRVLQQLVILLDWPMEGMVKWLPLIKSTDNKLPLAYKVAILLCFKSTMGEDPSYIHYQSELANRLSGLSHMKDLKTHWDTLVLLNTSVLNHGAFDIPRQRLIYLVQTIRPLLVSIKENDDDDNDDDDDECSRTHALVQAQFAQLLKYLAESISDISGSHWNDFLDCCFEWIAFADTSDTEELMVVYHGLKLLHTLLSIESNNESLQEALEERISILSKCILDLVAKEMDYYQNGPNVNEARMIYQELLARLLDFVPEKYLVDCCDDYFSKFNALIYSPNQVLQKQIYLVLKKCVAHKVQDLSVKLEFTETNEEEKGDVDIDQEVMNALLNPPDLTHWQSVIDDSSLLHDTLGYLLAWMLMFDHFIDITFKLKQEYTRQLKEQEAVSYLMPTLCKILHVGQNSTELSFDITPWSIIDYDTEGIDVTSDMTFLVLSSHLYYRALTHIPSLVRQWWIDCKHRQLTIAVEHYTEKYFSQQLIHKEIEMVNREDIKKQLEDNDDNEFTVKTSKSEVTAIYRVDEQNMQIAIKLPTNFPLRPIDVEGIQKVGVNDKQWRGWMFAVTAVIGSQNGNIVDALTVFKRNVNLHFNGVEDCTICYSIISAQDRSIPTKQCRTCKNKFHSSCLYKWFRSSNSASCPLCRTVF
ncbi:uncharacterized protein BX663DRAFT_534810 [Cokeromyces recurvatus]|uniref:uncharacterized protein n=1 Tax=Cokeromyces recurvatus TaxID=90255 RepID=UPI00221E5321|nr:uncharacterized protein BX663DRAFT_534810 [Cokeromyces recurvatus]KAI7906774.1 hypothetical protein BX663DRAFT_534810 [Cokeromyces recurvatus]